MFVPPTSLSIILLPKTSISSSSSRVLLASTSAHLNTSPLHLPHHTPLMYQPYLYHNIPSRRTQQKLARALIPLLVWICVALSLRYGYYGNRRLLLGPNTSRMITTSSIFVEQVQARDEANEGSVLYGFHEQPELSLEANWTSFRHLLVDSYGRQGFSLWLNKGSRIRVAWDTTYSAGFHGDLSMVLMKGEQNLEEVQSYYTRCNTNFSESQKGIGEAAYTTEEDNSYYIGVVNMHPQTVMLALNVNVSSRIYDISKASSICSTTNGLCKYKLHFPSTQYFVLTTPQNDIPIKVWYVEMSFTGRLAVYFVVLGLVAIVFYMIMKHLQTCEPERTQEEETTYTETDPILPTKDIPRTYGTIEEDTNSSSCCSSDDLNDQKICVICFDENRNCFFTPCGHSATCYACAKRIMEDENKSCPICRRLIHKIRRLIYP